MQYLNSNFVKAIEKNGNYQAAILKIQKEVNGDIVIFVIMMVVD